MGEDRIFVSLPPQIDNIETQYWPATISSLDDTDVNSLLKVEIFELNNNRPKFRRVFISQIRPDIRPFD